MEFVRMTVLVVGGSGETGRGVGGACTGCEFSCRNPGVCATAGATSESAAKKVQTQVLMQSEFLPAKSCRCRRAKHGFAGNRAEAHRNLSVCIDSARQG